MMWRVWDWGASGLFKKSTRLVLGQEFEHRWGMFLSPIIGGRDLQGDDAGCGRSAHWSFRVDGQGSGMEIREWTGTSPADRLSGTLNFNTDIGGVFSFPDLYLMGYVSPEEMDSGSSELRFMDNSCNSPYNGPIFDFGSAEIIQANGPRVPHATNSQRHFKTAWIMLHQPGAPAQQAAIDRALDIMELHQSDWDFGTLGRGTMDNSIAFGNFSATPQAGEAPHNVEFTFDSTLETQSWSWDFGDGGSSPLQDPTHLYGPGIYDVELEVATPFGNRFSIKKDYVTVWADTIDTPDLTVPIDTGVFYWELIGSNAIPIEDFVLPITLDNAPADVSFDSISIVGCRTSYFERKQLVFDDMFFGGRAAVLLQANFGGGSPPLPPGTGPIARLYLSTKPTATPNATITLSLDPIGLSSLSTRTTTTSFVPVAGSGVLTLEGTPCLCPCHADPQCNGATDVLDVVQAVNVAFRSAPSTSDPTCPNPQTDADCSGFTNVIDVVKFVNVAFRNADPATEFCDPCL
jgi:PKD repeat protein